MREVLFIHVGGCGVHVGQFLWNAMAAERGPHGACFSEEAALLRPRAVCIDLEQATRETLLSSGGVLGRSPVVVGQSGAGNNWARGFYTEGAEILEECMDALRREAEACDTLQGFALVHGTAGGTGGGLGSLLLGQLREEYGDRVLSTFSGIPMPPVDSLVEPYNVVLTYRHLAELADVCTCVDASAELDILFRVLHNHMPNVLADTDRMFASAVLETTRPLRMPCFGSSYRDLRGLVAALVPNPQLHFLVPGMAPLDRTAARALDLPQLVGQLFDMRRILAQNADRHPCSSLTAAVTFFGEDVTLRAVEDFLGPQLASNDGNSVPADARLSTCAVQAPGFSGNMSAAFLGNGRCVAEPFRRVAEMFRAMFRRRAFIHWFTDEGMEDSEFEEAEESFLHLIEAYQEGS